jgi:voltage-gated potassium channel
MNRRLTEEVPESGWRSKLHEIVFESDTTAGRAFDIIVICCIVLSVQSIQAVYGKILNAAEWSFTIVFTAEYILRLLSVKKPLRYVLSFYGLVDFFAILPTYLSVIFPGSQYLLTIRILRLLRIFRILKLTEYLNEANIITTALLASRRKIKVFLLSILTIVVIVGSLIYVVEGEENGFTDIPTSIYWAIVTITTVGYGDLSPKTPLGKALASVVMILGYAIIAVPTGIVTAELSKAANKQSVSNQSCPSCSAEGHDSDAVYCKYCAATLRN